MANIKRYTTGAVSLNGAPYSNIVADSVQISTSMQEAFAKAGGALIATRGAIMTNKLVMRFATRNVALLAVPVAISSFKMVMIQYDEATGLSTDEIEYEVDSGLAVPISINGAPGQESQLVVEIHPTSSTGLVNPIAVNASSSVALAAVAEQYTLGDAILAPSTIIENIQSIDLNFGYQVKSTEGESGLPYSKDAYIDSFDPEITFQSADLAQSTAANINTGSFPATGMIFEWRKVLEGAVPSGGYRLTTAKCRLKLNTLSGGLPANNQFSVMPVSADAAGTGFMTFATYS